MGAIASAHLLHLLQSGKWPEIVREASGPDYRQTIGNIWVFVRDRRRPSISFGQQGLYDFFGPLNTRKSDTILPLDFKKLPEQVPFDSDWAKLMAFDAWSYLIFNQGLPAPLTTIKRWYGDHAKALGTQSFHLCWTVRSIHEELMAEETPRAHSI